MTQVNIKGSSLPLQVWAKPQPQGKLAVYVVNPTNPTDSATDPNNNAPDPLSCFSEIPASSHKNNICFGQYKNQYPDITTPAGCATQCLQDRQCTQFVWALPGEEGTKCRLSHTCTTPTGYLGGFNSYTRLTAHPGCGVQPPPPATPANVTVTFSELGLDAAKAGVRDVWSRKDLADTEGNVLHVSVAPLDSVFVVLTPKS